VRIDCSRSAPDAEPHFAVDVRRSQDPAARELASGQFNPNLDRPFCSAAGCFGLTQRSLDPGYFQSELVSAVTHGAATLNRTPALGALDGVRRSLHFGFFDCGRFQSGLDHRVRTRYGTLRMRARC
jgi:hypothetical protein